MKAATDMTELAHTLRQFVGDNFLFGTDGDFSDDDSFLDNGIIDSTGVLELITFLESTYDITIEDEELVPENLDSITNVARFLARKRQAVPAPA
jgi:acyl carrier protein